MHSPLIHVASMTSWDLSETCLRTHTVTDVWHVQCDITYEAVEVHFCLKFTLNKEQKKKEQQAVAVIIN